MGRQSWKGIGEGMGLEAGRGIDGEVVMGQSGW